MFSSVLSAAVRGMESYFVQVEVSVTDGLPTFEMVGFLSSEVKEAKERVKVALYHSGILLPPKHITVNLSPANIKKEGNAYDLPIAIALLVAFGIIPKEQIENMLILGELGLDGEIKATKGILPMVLYAKANGATAALLSKENEEEGKAAAHLPIISAAFLKEAIFKLQQPDAKKTKSYRSWEKEIAKSFEQKKQDEIVEDFAEINGQKALKRAMEIAAAGFHNILLSGPPGGGKTMIAKRLPGILPPLSIQESIEISKVYSVAGMLSKENSLISKRPFLNPHHTISQQALSGGGVIPKPGIISLAHQGVLFLDELPEFKKATLEILRQPLEEKQIHIARSYGNYTYPADFMLVAAMNPCPCGYYPDRNKCNCSENEIRRYTSRLSGPLLDRMDLFVQIKALTLQELTKEAREESSETIRKRVEMARAIQKERYAKEEYHLNSAMPAKAVKKYCILKKEEEKFLEDIFKTLQLSARGYYRMLRVARSIADLEGREEIEITHLAEAACYRKSMEGERK